MRRCLLYNLRTVIRWKCRVKPDEGEALPLEKDSRSGETGAGATRRTRVSELAPRRTLSKEVETRAESFSQNVNERWRSQLMALA